MIKITLTVGAEEIEVTQAGVQIVYHKFSHEEFNSIVAAYRLLGFYKETTLMLAPKDIDTEVVATPDPNPVSDGVNF